jgi:hypothetical protein
MHFWWAVFHAFNGDFSAILVRQGIIAYTNFAITFLWTLDVVLAWAFSGQSNATARIALRFVTWAGVTTSFLVATAILRSGMIAQIGYALAAALVVALVVRLSGPSQPGFGATN